MNYMKDPEQTSAGEAALLGAEQGLFFSGADEIGGVMGAAIDAPGDYARGMQHAISEMQAPAADSLETSFPPKNANPHQGIEGLYKEYRDLHRAKHDVASEEHPAPYTLGAMGGGFAVPGTLGVKALKLGSKAGAIEKIGKGIAVGGLGGALNGAGMSEHSPISQPKEFGNDVLVGGEFGMALGGVVPGAAATAKGLAEGTKFLASPILKGFKWGAKGVNLLGEDAEKAVQQKIASFGREMSDDVIDNLDQLGILKRDLIDIASQNGVKLDAAEIDAMILRRVGSAKNYDDTASALPVVRREMEQLRELIRSHQEGPMVDKVSRVFYGDKPTQLKQFTDKVATKQMKQNLNQVDAPPGADDVTNFEQRAEMLRREQQAIPGSETGEIRTEYMPTGRDGEVHGIMTQQSSAVPGEEIVDGYRKVGAPQLIDADDAKQAQMVEEMLLKKQAEQRALPGQADPNEISVHYEPTDIPILDGAGNPTGKTKMLAVFRQQALAADTVEVGGQVKKLDSKILRTQAPKVDPAKIELLIEATDDPNMVLAYARQAKYDSQGRIIGYSDVLAPRLLPKEEAARFKDVAEKVRAGGRDMADLNQFNRYLKDLNEVGQFGGTPFKTQDALQTQGKLYTEGRDMFRNRVDGYLKDEFGASMPTVQGTDEKISAFKRGLETLRTGDNTVNPDIRDKQKMYETVSGLVNRQELVGNSGSMARERVSAFIAEIRKADPEMAARLEKQFADLGEQASVSKATAGLTQAGVVNTVKRSAVAVGNGMGLAVHGLSKLPPQAVRSLAAKAAAKGSKAYQGLANILGKLPDQDDRSRNAVIFGLMQHPEYRQWLMEQSELQPEGVK